MFFSSQMKNYNLIPEKNLFACNAIENCRRSEASEWWNSVNLNSQTRKKNLDISGEGSPNWVYYPTSLGWIFYGFHVGKYLIHLGKLLSPKPEGLGDFIGEDIPHCHAVCSQMWIQATWEDTLAIEDGTLGCPSGSSETSEFRPHLHHAASVSILTKRM